MKHLKKIMIGVWSVVLLIPLAVFASPVSVDRLNNDHIEPLVKTDFIKGSYFTATSTTATSTFPAASSTTFCLSSDCRSVWPSGSGTTTVSGPLFTFPFINGTNSLLGSSTVLTYATTSNQQRLGLFSTSTVTGNFFRYLPGNNSLQWIVNADQLQINANGANGMDWATPISSIGFDVGNGQSLNVGEYAVGTDISLRPFGTSTYNYILQASKMFVPTYLSVGQGADQPSLTPTIVRGIFDVNASSTLQAPSSVTVNFNSGTESPTGNYTATGQDFAFRVHPYKTINGVKYVSLLYTENSATDPNDSNPMTVDPTWASVTGATGYRVFFQDPQYLGTDFTGNFTYVDTTATTLHFGGDVTFQEENMSGFDENLSPPALRPDLYIDSETGVISSDSNKFNFAGDISATSFTGNGAGLTGISASGITTGTLAVPYGGTGINTCTNDRLITGNGTGAFVCESAATFDGHSLIVDGGNTIGNPAFTVTGSNFTRFNVINTLGSGSGGNYNISAFNMQTDTGYVQFAQYGTGSNNGTRWGQSLTGLAELSNVSLGGGSTGFVIGNLDALPLIFGTSALERFRLTGNTLQFSEGHNFVFGATTGTKIGTATTQKIGFYNATPIVQVPATTEIGVALSNLGLRASGTAYPITTTGQVTLGSATTSNLSVINELNALVLTATSTTATSTVQNFKISKALIDTANSFGTSGQVLSSTGTSTRWINGTISGISLGSNLADLTATDGTLTFSGTYNGSTARTIGLNLANANSWSAKQSFVSASTTNLTVNGFTSFSSVTSTTTATSTFAGAVRVTDGTILNDEYAVSTSSTMTIDWNKRTQQLIKLGSTAVTINMTNYNPGQILRIPLCQNSIGGATVTWDSAIKWASSTAPTLSAANHCDLITLDATAGTSTTIILGGYINF